MTVQRAVAAVCVVWALGTVFGEGLQQAAAAAAIVLALAALRRLRLAPDVRAFAFAALSLSAWQLLSPLLALALGTAPALPRSGRYTQALDTVAAAALASAASLGGIPWRALAGILGIGWGANLLLGVYQHLVRWPWGELGPLKVPIARLHHEFTLPGGPTRFAGSGFTFNRLRFAHGAVAMVGPALAWLVYQRRALWRLASAALLGALLAAMFIAYARAALGASLLVIAAGFLFFTRGWSRRLGLGAGVALVAVIAASPAWRARIEQARENLMGGERTTAMTAGWRLVQQHPVLGVGFGNHKPAALATGVPDLTDYLANDSHNLWLTAWAETGIPGLALMLVLHALLGRALLRRARSGSMIGAGALLSFVGFHVLSLVHYLPYHSGVLLAFSFVWGLALAAQPAEAVGALNDRQ